MASRVVAALVTVVALTLFAAACGGSEAAAPDVVPQEPLSGGQATPEDGATNADDGSTAVEASDSPEAAADDAPDAQEPAAINPEIGVDDPWEVAVLQVRDDVRIVPVFDAPNGNEIELYDINPIDDVELEYPLYGQTEFGNPLNLLVLDYDPTAEWAQVQVPVRPNGTTAWVETSNFTEQRHNYRITVDLSDNLLTFYAGDEVLLEQATVTGSASLPTPVGRTYIDEKVPGGDVDEAFGDWILSLAAFSEALGTAGGGGLPKIALHGTNEPELVGQSVSSGSIRVPNEVISIIADTAPIGTIVDIAP